MKTNLNFLVNLSGWKFASIKLLAFSDVTCFWWKNQESGKLSKRVAVSFDLSLLDKQFWLKLEKVFWKEGKNAFLENWKILTSSVGWLLSTGCK
jgi:hypothetical protein